MIRREVMQHVIPPAAGHIGIDAMIQDSYDLVVVRPGELNTENIHTNNQVIGNTYWCGTGLDPAHQNDCGA